jgi:tetratricopeptide (TPR) repeat protein
LIEPQSRRQASRLLLDPTNGGQPWTPKLTPNDFSTPSPSSGSSVAGTPACASSRPGHLFAWTFGGEERVDLGPFLEHLERQTGTTVLLGRIDRILRHAGSPKIQGQDDEAPRPGDEFRECLAEIDELRFSLPREAREPAYKLLSEVLRATETGREPLVTLCDALAQVGSIDCALGRYSEAAACLWRGLKLSRHLELPVREASLLRRCSFLVANFGKHGVALLLADEACQLSTLAHDLAGVGQALCVRGIMLDYSGDTASAVKHYQSALGYLSPMAWQHRYGVCQPAG